MLSPSLYRRLVPDPVRHKRTESDRGFFDARFLSRRAGAQGLRMRETRPGLRRPSLISTYEGAMRRLLFVFPPYVPASPDLVAAYRSLLAELRSGTHFAVVCTAADREAVAGWFEAAGHKDCDVVFAEMPAFARFTDWAEDAYVGLTDLEDGTAYLMEPWEFRRSGDALIADAVEEFTGDIRAAQSPLIFQGGNCLIADDHWMLGRDYFVDTLQFLDAPGAPVNLPPGADPADVARTLFGEYLDARRGLLLLGSEAPLALPELVGAREGGRFFLDLAAGGTGAFQPIFHIDMLVTLAGDLGAGFQVLVGDPTLADEMLGTTSPYALAGAYDTIAAQLEAAGYLVRRNPLVHWPSEGRSFTLAELADFGAQPPPDEPLLAAVADLRDLGATEDSEVTVREWHHITWNNCLVENSAAVGRHVYLPTFGHGPMEALAAIDARMREEWRALGFEVHMLGDFNPFAARQGVVHCVKKYLERGDAPPAG